MRTPSRAVGQHKEKAARCLDIKRQWRVRSLGMSHGHPLRGLRHPFQQHKQVPTRKKGVPFTEVHIRENSAAREYVVEDLGCSEAPRRAAFRRNRQE